jgi:hypothetical protein
VRRRLTQEQIQDRLVLGNSVERVINTTLRLLPKLTLSVDEAISEDASVCIEDWEALREVVVRLFDEERNRAFLRANPQLPNEVVS